MIWFQGEIGEIVVPKVMTCGIFAICAISFGLIGPKGELVDCIV